MRGKHNHNAAEKRRSDEQYAYEHWEKVSDFTFGRPCLSSCPYGRNCGMMLTPMNLLNAHERVFGTKLGVCQQLMAMAGSTSQSSSL
eukprot:5416615-Pleurochrysis_carterae.AAC.3